MVEHDHEPIEDSAGKMGLYIVPALLGNQCLNHCVCFGLGHLAHINRGRLDYREATIAADLASVRWDVPAPRCWPCVERDRRWTLPRFAVFFLAGKSHIQGMAAGAGPQDGNFEILVGTLDEWRPESILAVGVEVLNQDKQRRTVEVGKLALEITPGRFFRFFRRPRYLLLMARKAESSARCR